MTIFWTAAVFAVFGFITGCGKDGIYSNTEANVDVNAGADADANIDADAGAYASADMAEDEDNDGDAEDAFRSAYPDIAGVWTMTCHSDLIEEVNFNLTFFFFQDGTLIRGAEGGSEDAYCYGTVRSDGQVSLIMEEACTGSTVTFTGAVASPSLVRGRYFWEWIDAYGTSHHDEGAWHANPSPEYCSPYPSVAGDWSLTYRNGRVEYTTITVEQTDNTIKGQGLDGCEYLGAFSLTSECNELRIYRRCPDTADQTQVLFGIFNNPGQMSGSWYSMNNAFGCPEIRSGRWSANRL